jgi:hypothetical protein
MVDTASIVDALLSVLEGYPWVLSDHIDVIFRLCHLLVEHFLERPGVGRRFEAYVVGWVSREGLGLDVAAVENAGLIDKLCCCFSCADGPASTAV